MQTEGFHHPVEEQTRSVTDGLSSFINEPKKPDVVYIRMESPSQLEKEYELGPVVGEGTFGVVQQGIRRKDGVKCAIKKILRQRTFSATERARLDREISILRLVSHPGIIRLYSVAETSTMLFLITEFCEGNTLSSCLDELPEQTGLAEYVVVEIVRQVTSALSYLHNRGIVHRDLKANNIMLLHKVELDFRKLVAPDTDNDIPTMVQVKSGQTLESVDYLILPNASSSRSVISENRPTRTTRRVVSKLKNSKTTSTNTPSVSTGATTTRSRRSLLFGRDNPKSNKFTLYEAAQMPPSTKMPPPLLKTKIIDFGLAIEVRKIEESLDSQCGTLLYMAPEVIAGRSYTRQCDVWSLGILMYQLLTRQLPCMASTEEQVVNKITSFDVRKTLRQPVTTISPLAQQCLIRALDPDPAYRYSASELIRDPWVTQYRTTCQDDVSLELDDLKRFSLNSPTVSRVPARATVVSDDGKLSTISAPPCIGFLSSSNLQPTPNVLELMKQYHKELEDQKLLHQKGGS